MQSGISEKQFVSGSGFHEYEFGLDLLGDDLIAISDVIDQMLLIWPNGLLAPFQYFLGCMLLDGPEVILCGVIREGYGIAVDGITLFTQGGEKPPLHRKPGWEVFTRYRYT